MKELTVNLGRKQGIKQKQIGLSRYQYQKFNAK